MQSAIIIKKYLNTLCLKNRSGSATVISLIVLAALTMIGLAATQTSQMELSIVGNEKIYKQNLNMAEGAAKEVVKVMDNEPNRFNLIPDISPYKWLNPNTTNEDFSQFGDWDQTGNDQNSQTATLSPSAYNSVIFQGIDSTSSLSMTKKGKIYVFSVYGMSRMANGTVIIDMGYRKRI